MKSFFYSEILKNTIVFIKRRFKIETDFRLEIQVSFSSVLTWFIEKAHHAIKFIKVHIYQEIYCFTYEIKLKKKIR